MVILVTGKGVGRHVGDVGLVAYMNSLYYIFITTSVMLSPQIFTKASIGLTLLRIAAQKPYRIAIIANTIFMLVVSGGTLVVSSGDSYLTALTC